MLRLLHGTHLDFIKWWKWTTAITLAFMIPAVLLIFVTGFNQSVEFTGGTLMELRFHAPPGADALRSTLAKAGVSGAEIQRFGSDTDYVIRAQDQQQVAEQVAGAAKVSDVITRALTQRYGAQPQGFQVLRTEAVGPKVGGELRQKAALAMLISFVITLLYLAWRFEWRFGLAAIVATVHDFVATLAWIKYMNLEISLVVVAGILTMIGYSMNDTIIIFDRVRENLRAHRKLGLYEILNRSVNEVVPRTILTGGTTLASLLALLIFAGPVIRPFAWVMLFGVITGTFSSIYVASPILLYIERRWPRELGAKSGVARASVDRSRRPAREHV